MTTELHEAVDQAALIIDEAVRGGSPAIGEAAAKRILSAYGVPVPRGGVARSAGEAAEVAASLGGPVVAKAVGPLIQHKTEAQLVMLDLRSARDVEAAYCTLAERAGDALEAVLVEEMLAGSREFMVGMKRDAAFGTVLAFGLGGTMTEVFHDIALAIPPVDERDVAELLELIQARGLLGRFRGQPPVDRGALVEIVQAVARIALDHPRIAEIDVNPLLVAAGKPVAADALMVVASAGATDSPARRMCLAVVGASADVTRWGGSALQNIVAGGFKGEIYPVNPRGGEILGLPAYASIDDLPAAPDLALLAIRAEQLDDALSQCGRRGVRAAVAIAAGFSETGAAGEAAERSLAETAAAAGVTVIGPNCMGLIANASDLHATGFIALHPRAGRMGIVSQSGNLGVQLSALADRRDMGVRCFVNVGNEAQVTAVDVLEHLKNDDETGCVLMYLEGIDDGRRFFAVARETSAVKPVVVLRGGLTEQGGRAAASHTGAMAGSSAVYEAAARQAGVVSCTSVQEALDLTVSLAHLPLPRGPRVAVVTNGGGAELNAVLPPFWSHRNPIDLVATAGGDVGPRALAAVAACPTVDAILVLSVLGVPNTGDEVRAQSRTGDFDDFSPWEARFLEGVADLMTQTGKPIINVPDLPLRRALYTCERRFTPVVLPTPRAAALVLERMWRYGAWRAEHGSDPK
jgi:acyl-CoA synthetase (NDP forming)